MVQRVKVEVLFCANTEGMAARRAVKTRGLNILVVRLKERWESEASVLLDDEIWVVGRASYIGDMLEIRPIETVCELIRKAEEN